MPKIHLAPLLSLVAGWLGLVALDRLSSLSTAGWTVGLRHQSTRLRVPQPSRAAVRPMRSSWLRMKSRLGRELPGRTSGVANI